MPELNREASSVLTELWSLSPDIRLGQLMAHLDFLCNVHLDKGLGYVEDDELVAIMYRHKRELLSRTEGEPAPSKTPKDVAQSVSGSTM